MQHADILQFLHVPTPAEWVASATSHEHILLVDHANCERKAARAALLLCTRYHQSSQVQLTLSRIVREEMRHFEQVIGLLRELEYPLTELNAGRYAASLHRFARNNDSGSVDDLLLAAIIEARSYERFLLLSSVLRPPICDLYRKLGDSEFRHFQTYLEIARDYESRNVIDSRLQELLAVEATLISSEDPTFRFHSGFPLNGKHSSESEG